MIKRFKDFERIDDVTAGAKVITPESELNDMLPILCGCLGEILHKCGRFGSSEMIARCNIEGDTAYYETESNVDWGRDGYLLVYMMPETFTPYMLFSFSEDDVDLHHLKISDFSFSSRDIDNKITVTTRLEKLNPNGSVNRLVAKIRVHK